MPDTKCFLLLKLVFHDRSLHNQASKWTTYRLFRGFTKNCYVLIWSTTTVKKEKGGGIILGWKWKMQFLAVIRNHRHPNKVIRNFKRRARRDCLFPLLSTFLRPIWSSLTFFSGPCRCSGMIQVLYTLTGQGRNTTISIFHRPGRRYLCDSALGPRRKECSE